MKITALIVIFACVAWQVNARAQDDEVRAAPPSRGLLKRGLLAGKGKQTTTTTTAAPQEEVEYEDEAEYQAEAEGDAQTEAPVPSSTEGKKLVGQVRPFRSNTDLLESLKRRRAQAAEAKLHGPTSTAAAVQEAPTEAPVKASFTKKRFNTGTRDAATEESAAPAKPTKSRFGRPSSRSLPEAEPEEQNDAAPPARTGRTFSRRGGN